MQFLDDILNIFFPNLCSTCSNALMKNEELLCFHCRSELPNALFIDLNNNELTNRIYGKLGIDFGASFLYYYKSGITQKLLHQFKCNNYPEIGELIGSWFGHELLDRNIKEMADIIIPVPLHPKKERKRGYNQSHFRSHQYPY